MKWLNKFDDAKTWSLEGAPVNASVSICDDGDYRVFLGAGMLTFPASTPLADVLAAAIAAVVADLRDMLATMESAAPTVETETSPVELIPGSEGKAGYGYGWIRVRSDRSEPASWEMAHVRMDGGIEANCHPFIFAGAELAATLGVPVETRVAGIRWTEKE